MTDSISKYRSKSTSFVFYGILTIGALLVLVPFWWMIITSFDRLRSAAMPNPPRFLPANWTLYNYEVAFSNVNMVRSTLNNFILIIISFVANALVATLAGFALSKGKFPLRNTLLIFFLSTMMVPFESRVLYVFQFINKIGLLDSYAGYLLPPVMTCAFYIFLMKKAFDDVPDSLMESAHIDGAPLFIIYCRIYLPLIGPMLAALAVLDSVGIWNDMLWPLIVLRSKELYTVQISLVRYVTSHPGIVSAVVMMSVVPIATVFLICQKWIVQGIATSGMKS